MADKEQSVAADALDVAAMEAIASQTEEQVVEEVIEEQPEEPKEQVEQEVAEAEEEEPPAEEPEADEEGLPKAHGERSKLGRKLSAYHRRVDELENSQREQFARIENLLQRGLTSKPKETRKKKEPEPNQLENFLSSLDPDEPLTVKEAMKLFQGYQEEAERIADEKYHHNKEAEETRTREYRDNYDKAIFDLASSLGTPEDREKVFEELTTMSYNPTSDPLRDAELNWRKAETAYLRKQVAVANRTVPTKGEKPPATVTKPQAKVPKQEKKVELDPWAEKYLKFAESANGSEYVDKLLKE